jgi:hypothetical protein
VRLVGLSASDCKRLWKDFFYKSRKEDIVRCAYLLSFVELILWLYACRRLRESNKEDKELVDVAPGWG